MKKDYLETEKTLLRDGVEIKLKNPGTQGIGDFLIISRDMSKTKRGKDGLPLEGENPMSHLSPEGIKSLVNLVNLTLKKSFPNEINNGIINDDLDQWAMQNSMLLMNKIMSMCSTPKTIEQIKKETIVEKIKKVSE